MKTALDYKNDFQTPPFVANYMASLLPENHVQFLLEPTPGQGNIVRACEAAGFSVYSPNDFFSIDRGRRFDAVVMNPPFSSKFAWNVPEHLNKHGMRLGYYMLQECMQKDDIVIALMPWFTISDSDVRLRALKKWGLKSVTALPRKTFQFARVQTVVIELVKGWHFDTKFIVFDLLGKKPIPELFEENEKKQTPAGNTLKPCLHLPTNI